MLLLNDKSHLRPHLISITAAAALAIGMGFGRFSFTGILPVMIQENILSLTSANYAASSNYMGYLLGALILSRARPESAKKLCVVSMLSTTVCMILLSIFTYPPSITLIRFFSGVFSAFSIVSASLWLLQHMRHTNGAPMMFSGVGIGIFISAECIFACKTFGVASQCIWLICGVITLIPFIMVYKFWAIPAEEISFKINHIKKEVIASEYNRGAAYKLLFVYGFSGFGYIITATYLPLFLKNSLTSVDPIQIWAIFGLSVIPSCFFWHKFVKWVGFKSSLIVNLLLQAIGVIFPVFGQSMGFCIISAALVGFTFMGTVTITLPVAKKLNKYVKFNMIAAMTTVYGIGQILGPLVANKLFIMTHGFNSSLITAALVLLIASMVCLSIKKSKIKLL